MHSGIERVARNEKELADKIRVDVSTLRELQDKPEQDKSKIDALAAQVRMEHEDFRRSAQIDSLRPRSSHHHRAARVRAQPRSSPSPELSDALFAAARRGRRLLQRESGRFPAVGAFRIPGDVR